MFFLAATFSLADGSIISGAAIKDQGSLRYVGDDMHEANAGLGDMVTAQDLVSRLYNANAQFREAFIQGLIYAGYPGVAIAYTPSTDVATWHFGAHLPDGQSLIIAGTSDGEGTTMRTNNLARAVALLEADSEFVEALSGVII
jgi:hypothetical protein